MRGITQNQWTALEFMLDNNGMVAGGGITTRILESLQKKKLARTIGSVTVCGADGYALEPERIRIGWNLTALGRKTVEDARSADRKRMEVFRATAENRAHATRLAMDES